MTSEDVLKALAGGRQPKDAVFTLCLYLGVSEKQHSFLFMVILTLLTGLFFSVELRCDFVKFSPSLLEIFD